MKKKLLAAAAAVFTLTGCMQGHWVKPGASQQDFAKDSYECERDMRQSGYYGGGIVGAINAQEFGSRCMNARGYTFVQK